MSTEHFPRRAPTPEPRSAPVALGIILVAAFAVVLAALPYPVFELDRYTFPKELVVEVAGFAAALVCVASARRLTLFAVTSIGRLASGHVWVGALIVGIVELGVGALLVKRGLHSFSEQSYSLEQTRESLKEIAGRR